MSGLVGRSFPRLVRQSWNLDSPIAAPGQRQLEDPQPSRVGFWVRGEASLDQFWKSTGLTADNIAALGYLVLLEGGREFDAAARVFAAWDGEAATAPDTSGLALELKVGPSPILEAERVRRIVSWAPRRFLEAGKSRTPELLVYGCQRALRELPRGLVDIALVQAEGLEQEDLQIGRSTVVWAPAPIQARPAWAGLPVLVGPELYWREPWMEDCRRRWRP